MSSSLIDLRHPAALDIGVVGGKTARLAALLQAGFPVPIGFCLTVDALPDPELHQSGDVIIDARLRSDLLHRWAALDAPHGVAVRSSATTEDAESASAAGQYDSVVSVRTGPALLDAVETVWRSLNSAAAVHYRSTHPSDHPARMAVLIHTMVDPRWAGVMFTSTDPHPDPHSNSDVGAVGKGVVLIEAVPGLAGGLVDGTLTPHQLEISRQPPHRILRAEHPDPAAPGTHTAHDLPDDQLAELAALGLQIETHFGAPQDVEWVLTADGPAVVQARPITAPVPRLPPPTLAWVSPIPVARWARMSICDSWLSQPLSPLFATAIFPRLVDVWATNWGGPPAARARNPVIPHPMHGTVNGYAYLRFDFPLSRHPARTAVLLGRWTWFHLSPVERRWRRKVLPRLHTEVARVAALPLATVPAADLLADLQRLIERTADYWAIIGGLAWHWNASEACLTWFLQRIPGAGAVSVAALLSDDDRHAQRSESRLDDLAATTDPDEHAQLLAGYLADFGHLVYHLDIAEPTPAEDVTAIQAALQARHHRSTPAPDAAVGATARRRDAEEQITKRLPPLPGVHAGWSRLLRWAQHWSSVRDQTLHAFTAGWPTLRSGYLELGQRLHRAGIIDHADDVFYLTAPELQAWATRETSPSHASLAVAVAERRATRADQARHLPPDVVPADARIDLFGIDITHLALFGVAAAGEQGGTLHGSAVSPGTYTGPARPMQSPADAVSLQDGDVLVISHLTPAWAPLLVRVGAVVADAGGALSHGSVVAREYGIPTVLGTKQAMARINTGQLLTVDGAAGTVTLGSPITGSGDEPGG